MKKKFKAKVSGMFDIVQLGDDTFSEVVDREFSLSCLSSLCTGKQQRPGSSVSWRWFRV